MQRAVCLAGVVWLTLTLSAAGFDPLMGDYARSDQRDVRVLSYNHGRNFIADADLDDVFTRILTVIDPDIICFQECTGDVSDATIVTRLNDLLPVDGGGTWHIHPGLPTGIRTVIASRFPKLQRFVDKHECGICVDPMSSGEVLGAVKRLLGNPALARQMGARGRDAVHAHYSWERESEKLLELYQEILPPGSSRARNEKEQ